MTRRRYACNPGPGNDAVRVTLGEIKAWRAAQHASGRPSELKDFFAAHGMCIACKGNRVRLLESDHLTDRCPDCRGTGGPGIEVDDSHTRLEPRPYVVVCHRPTGRGWTMDRAYGFIGEVDDPGAVVRRYRLLNEWQAWKPTQAGQMPGWAFDLPDAEFVAFWIEERTPLVSADALLAAALAGFSEEPTDA